MVIIRCCFPQFGAEVNEKTLCKRCRLLLMQKIKRNFMLEKLVSQEITNMTIKYCFIYISKKYFVNLTLIRLHHWTKIYSVQLIISWKEYKIYIQKTKSQHIDLKIFGDKLIKTLGAIQHIKLHTKYIPYVLGNIISNTTKCFIPFTMCIQ